jgi:hypothetical protein
MEIITGVSPNCSEATIRLRVDNIPEDVIKKLIKKIEINCGYHDNDPKEADWDDDKVEKEYEWLSTCVWRKKIFGTDCITIKGDAPYNCSEEIELVISKYITKPEIEFEDE